ncbi:hypothetical protein ACWDR0_20165 [Streptomyces sp. NPDC003691]
MTSPAETPIDAVPAGTVDTAPGTVVTAADTVLALRRADRLEVYDTGAFLAGGGPLHAVDVPEEAPAAPLGDGAVIAGADRVRAVGTDGGTRWELPHPPWRGCSGPPRAPGAPAVSPDGSLIGVLVPTADGGTECGGPAPDGPPGFPGLSAALCPGRDVLLLVDAADGRIRASRPLNSRASVVTQRWHPGGKLLGLSCWTAWHSWSTWWVAPRHDGLHLRGGARMREVVGFVPGTDRPLTLRRAERLTPGDDRDEIAVHEICADEPVALYDLTELGGRAPGTGSSGAEGHRESDAVFEDACALDARHLLVTARRQLPGRRPAARHWLCSAATLRPLGALRYPVPPGPVTALGDGTWLTEGARGFHRWSLPGR